MQKVKFVLREVGSGAGMLSADEFEEYLNYKVLGDGYKLYKQAEYPIYGNNNDFIGMRIFLTFTKEE